MEEAALLLDGYGVCDTRGSHVCELRVCDTYANGSYKMATPPDDAVALNFRTNLFNIISIRLVGLFRELR